MTVEECTKLMINASIEGHLSTADIVDKYCEWASLGLRNSLISDLEYVKHLYKLKRILKQKMPKLYLGLPY